MLVVHLNRGELYGVEHATGTASVDGPFSLELRNHGQAVHVHLRLDDDLARVADLNGTNLFVDTESVVTVPVEVAESAPPASGTLTVVSGYGKGETQIEVRVVDEDTDAVAVDEDLGRVEPAGAGDDGTGDRRYALVDALTRARSSHAVLSRTRGALLVGGLILLALGVSGIALLAAPGLAVVLGILAVLVGVGVAAYLMVR